MIYTRKTAHVSNCGSYRYSLTREWARPSPAANDKGGSACLFVMLNPSTADGMDDDPTIRRCVSFANSWGYGRLVVCNLFALRATDPRALYKSADPVGSLNVVTVAANVVEAGLIVCAWGVYGHLKNAGSLFVDGCRRNGHAVHHLGLTTAGHPRHPLYLPATTTPTLWTA